MRDKYYSDNRDLVKWSVLLALAERHSAKHILQVLYYRPTEWATVELDGEHVAIPAAVLRHFRMATGVTAIDAPVPVEVVAELFTSRAGYSRLVTHRIRARSATPGLILLDPDTGLESSKPSLSHVLSAEVAKVWSELTPGDVLVFYQHQTNRSGEPWIAQKREQFERAVGLASGVAKVAKSAPIAPDVVFFYAEKG